MLETSANRTDLAVEFVKTTPYEGVTVKKHRMPFPVTETTIQTGQAAKLLGKPMGRYITVEGLDFSAPPISLTQISMQIASLFANLLPCGFDSAMVVGLGNRFITPDSLGARTAERILVTRHFAGEQAGGLEKLRQVSVFAPGVLGQTGMESGECIAALVQKLHPDVLIVVDALAAASEQRLCTCLQFSDTGIVPGSGVANHRHAISIESLGVPVLSIGVPTVIAYGEERELFVTPRDIDLMMEHASKLIAQVINLALHPQVSAEDLAALVG